MRVQLPPGVTYSYSLAPNSTVTVEVLEGGRVERTPAFGPSTGQPVTIEPGDSYEFDVPGYLAADDGALIDLAYEGPPVDEVELPEPE